MSEEAKNETFDDEERYRIVLCGANSYDKKYYFNRKFSGLPESIQEELHIICVLFTEEAGGILTFSFTPYGDVVIDTQSEEGDLLYDEIGAPLLVKEIRKQKKDLIEALSVYFKVKFLHQDPSVLLDEGPQEGDEDD